MKFCNIWNCRFWHVTLWVIKYISVASDIETNLIFNLIPNLLSGLSGSGHIFHYQAPNLISGYNLILGSQPDIRLLFNYIRLIFGFIRPDIRIIFGSIRPDIRLLTWYQVKIYNQAWSWYQAISNNLISGSGLIAKKAIRCNTNFRPASSISIANLDLSSIANRALMAETGDGDKPHNS